MNSGSRRLSDDSIGEVVGREGLATYSNPYNGRTVHLNTNMCLGSGYIKLTAGDGYFFYVAGSDHLVLGHCKQGGGKYKKQENHFFHNGHFAIDGVGE